MTRKIAFLDRDGVINKKPLPQQYVNRVEDFKLNPGVVSTLTQLKKDGFEFIVVTNQRGIARGHTKKDALLNIHDHMKQTLRQHSIEILDIFHCPHDIDTCECRKPKDGLLRQATDKYKIDLASSLFISDSEADVLMAKAFGIGQTIHIPSDQTDLILSQYEKPRTRIAFVKFGGASSGGTEKFLQIIAANLPKDRFQVDYYYCDTVPLLYSDFTHPPTDPERIAYLEEHGVRLIKFHVRTKDMSTYDYRWLDTDFWYVFDEDKYDIIQTGKAGRIEYPFNKIYDTPIVDSVHLRGGVDNQYNISRVLHITDMMAKQWTRDGGDPSRIVRISLPVDIPDQDFGNYRSEMDIESKFVFGFHQRPDDAIFSPIPLEAYSKAMNEKSYFLLLGGSVKYQDQAKELGIKSITFLPATGDKNIIFKFLSTLDVYTHGRKDGENNSQAIAEAMHFGLPIVSHYSVDNNGHVETIRDAGMVVRTIEEYVTEMYKLKDDHSYYTYRSERAKANFNENYRLENQIQKIISVYEDVLNNPYPNPLRRLFYSLHYTQTLRPLLANIYYFFKFRRWGKIRKLKKPNKF